MSERQVSYIIFYDDDFNNIKIQEYKSRPINENLIYKQADGSNLVFCSREQALKFLNDTFLREYIYEDFRVVSEVDWDSMKK